MEQQDPTAAYDSPRVHELGDVTSLTKGSVPGDPDNTDHPDWGHHSVPHIKEDPD